MGMKLTFSPEEKRRLRRLHRLRMFESSAFLSIFEPERKEVTAESGASQLVGRILH
jgi:hypothetical protein